MLHCFLFVLLLMKGCVRQVFEDPEQIIFCHFYVADLILGYVSDLWKGFCFFTVYSTRKKFAQQMKSDQTSCCQIFHMKWRSKIVSMPKRPIQLFESGRQKISRITKAYCDRQVSYPKIWKLLKHLKFSDETFWHCSLKYCITPFWWTIFRKKIQRISKH